MSVWSGAMELQRIGMGHPAVRQVLAVRNNTAPNRFGLVAAEGLWENLIVLAEGLEVDAFFWCPEAARSDEAPQRAEELASRARRAFRVSGRTLSRMAERPNPDGLVTLARMPSWTPEAIALGASALVLVADGIEIPGNLGTLIRTMDGCRADLLVLTNRRTRMSHPKVLRGSQGTSLRVPHVEFEKADHAIDWLVAREFTIHLADTREATSYRSADYRGRVAIVVGSERYGVTKPWHERGFQRVAVPMLGRADSLNVAVSASILLYEARAQQDGWS